MNDQPIEFDTQNANPDIPEIVRKSFRVPLENTQDVWVRINDRRYSVLDINFNGVRIAIEGQAGFNIEQAFTHCEFNLFDLSIKGLSGKVVHRSLNETKGWQCGILWTDLHMRDAERILEIVSTMKKQLLKDDEISLDSP